MITTTITKTKLYAVFSDYQFQGLFRSQSAADRWAAELLTYLINFVELPIVEMCDENSTFDHRQNHHAANDARKAIYWGHYGRKLNY